LIGEQLHVFRRDAGFVEGVGADFSDWPTDEQVSKAVGRLVGFFAKSFHPGERAPVKIYDVMEGAVPAVRSIDVGDENMGTAEASGWSVGDRVAYSSELGLDAAFSRVRELLSRRGLKLHDDGAGYVVRAADVSSGQELV
jgi:hypothetical protein